MSGKPIAYLMEQTLGNVTHYLNLRSAEATAQAPAPLWLPIEFRASRLPWTLTGGYLARKALIDVIPQVSGVFMHTTTLSLLSVDVFRRVPFILSTDGTPSNKRHMREAYGLREQGLLRERVTRSLHKRVFRRAAALVGWSEWVRRSFVEDYGCREDDIAVIPPGVDVGQFVAGDRAHALPRILFVGGSFERKGGTVLLDVFRRRLRGRAELVLVTQGRINAGPGITVHKSMRPNSAELRELYATSDLFVLPTFADCFSLVLLEALAAGLPVVSTRVGGIPDIIREGKTGYLVNPGDANALGDAIEALIVDEGLRRSMGEEARQDALARFDARTNARRLFQFVRSYC